MDGPETAELDIDENREFEAPEQFTERETEIDVAQQKNEDEPKEERDPPTIEDRIREDVEAKGGEKWDVAFKGDKEHVFDRDTREVVNVRTGESLTRTEMESGDPAKMALMQEIMQRLEAGQAGFIKLPDHPEQYGDETTLYVTYVILDKDGGVSYTIMSTTFRSNEEAVLAPERSESSETHAAFRWSEEIGIDPSESGNALSVLVAEHEQEVANENWDSLETISGEEFPLAPLVNVDAAGAAEEGAINITEQAPEIVSSTQSEKEVPAAERTAAENTSTSYASEATATARTETSNSIDSQWLAGFLNADKPSSVAEESLTVDVTHASETAVPELAKILETEPADRDIHKEISEPAAAEKHIPPAPVVDAASRAESPFIAIKEENGRIHIVEQTDKTVLQRENTTATSTPEKVGPDKLAVEPHRDIKIVSVRAEPKYVESRTTEHATREVAPKFNGRSTIEAQKAKETIDHNDRGPAQERSSSPRSERLEPAKAHEIFLRSLGLQINARTIEIPGQTEGLKTSGSRPLLNTDDVAPQTRRSFERDGITLITQR